MAMKGEEIASGKQIVQFEHSDFNRIVLDFMIKGMHHPSLLEDPTFETLLNGEIDLVSNSEIFPSKYREALA